MMRRPAPFGSAVFAFLSLVLLSGCQEEGERMASRSEESKLVEVKIKKDKDKKFAVPHEAPANKNGTNPSDRVVWKNESGERIVLDFEDRWPFDEKGNTIPLESGAVSGTFTVAKGAQHGSDNKYEYKITPEPPTDRDSANTMNGDPPGDPAVLVGG